MSSVLKPGLFEAAMMSNFYLSLQRYIERSKNNPPNSLTVPDRFIQVSIFMHYEDHCKGIQKVPCQVRGHTRLLKDRFHRPRVHSILRHRLLHLYLDNDVRKISKFRLSLTSDFQTLITHKRLKLSMSFFHILKN